MRVDYILIRTVGVIYINQVVIKSFKRRVYERVNHVQFAELHDRLTVPQRTTTPSPPPHTHGQRLLSFVSIQVLGSYVVKPQ